VRVLAVEVAARRDDDELAPRMRSAGDDRDRGRESEVASEVEGGRGIADIVAVGVEREDEYAGRNVVARRVGSAVVDGREGFVARACAPDGDVV
jgi:hypothetical protein